VINGVPIHGLALGRGIGLGLEKIPPAARYGPREGLTALFWRPLPELLADAVPDALRANSFLDTPPLGQELLAIEQIRWDEIWVDETQAVRTLRSRARLCFRITFF